MSALTLFCALSRRACSAGVSVPSLSAFFCIVSTFASCFSRLAASFVVNSPLCRPCSIRCCCFASRSTVAVVPWAYAKPEVSAALIAATTVFVARFMGSSVSGVEPPETGSDATTNAARSAYVDRALVKRCCGLRLSGDPVGTRMRPSLLDLEPIMRGIRWIDKAVGIVIAAAMWLVLPLAFLLLAQWPLREVVQQYSREANDLGQILFALYVAVALSCATRRDAHLATDVIAHRYPPRFRAALLRVGLAVTLVPWSLYVLATGTATVWRSIVALEAFPETYNPGYFVVKVATWILAALLLLQA